MTRRSFAGRRNKHTWKSFEPRMLIAHPPDKICFCSVEERISMSSLNGTIGHPGESRSSQLSCGMMTVGLKMVLLRNWLDSPLRYRVFIVNV